MLTSAHHCDTLFSRGSQWRITPNLPPRMQRVRRAKSLLRGATSTEWLSGQLRRPLENTFQNRSENQIAPIPPIVPERIFVQVGLQVLLAHGVIDSADSPLYQTPESLDGLSVNIPHDIDPLRVLDAAMYITILRGCQPIIDRILIAVHGARRQNLFFDDRVESRGFNVGSDASDDAPAAPNTGVFSSLSRPRIPREPCLFLRFPPT